MIQLRFITRTHYQVDEPAFLSLLIQKCSSPIRSDYGERIAARFVEQVGNLTLSGRKTNLAAAKYLVDLSKALSLLNANLVWTSLGHTLRLVCRPVGADFNFELNLKERIFIFRLFLEADGAAILFTARELLKANDLPADGHSWVDFANQMFVGIHNEYLSLATDIRQRTALRQALKKRERQPFTGKSGPHQSIVHIQTLYRLGLAEKCEGNQSRRYCVGGGRAGLQALCERVASLSVLEGVVAGNTWPELAFAVFRGTSQGSTKAVGVKPDRLAQCRVLYGRVMATGVPLCSIQSLIEAAQIEDIALGREPTSFDEMLREMRRWQEKWPHDVRFHVDRYGRPAYLKLTGDFEEVEERL